MNIYEHEQFYGFLSFFLVAMPKILRWRNITTFSVGLSKELECATTANPPANVTWIHVSSNTTMMSSHLRKNVLKFESMDSTKEGEYKCIASNEFGEVTLVTYVQIAGGRSLNLVCAGCPCLLLIK